MQAWRLEAVAAKTRAASVAKSLVVVHLSWARMAVLLHMVRPGLIKTVSTCAFSLALHGLIHILVDQHRHMAAAHQTFDLEFALSQDTTLDDSGINLDDNIEAKFAAAMHHFPPTSQMST